MNFRNSPNRLYGAIRRRLYPLCRLLKRLLLMMTRVCILDSRHDFYLCIEHGTTDDRLVRIMLQRWLTRICEDPILLEDEELRLFIESDFGVRHLLYPICGLLAHIYI